MTRTLTTLLDLCVRYENDLPAKMKNSRGANHIHQQPTTNQGPLNSFTTLVIITNLACRMMSLYIPHSPTSLQEFCLRSALPAFRHSATSALSRQVRQVRKSVRPAPRESFACLCSCFMPILVPPNRVRHFLPATMLRHPGHAINEGESLNKNSNITMDHSHAKISKQQQSPLANGPATFASAKPKPMKRVPNCQNCQPNHVAPPLVRANTE